LAERVVPNGCRGFANTTEPGLGRRRTIFRTAGRTLFVCAAADTPRKGGRNTCSDRNMPRATIGRLETFTVGGRPVVFPNGFGGCTNVARSACLVFNQPGRRAAM
jgi:hypothetical protein